MGFWEFKLYYSVLLAFSSAGLSYLCGTKIGITISFIGLKVIMHMILIQLKDA